MGWTWDRCSSTELKVSPSTLGLRNPVRASVVSHTSVFSSRNKDDNDLPCPTGGQTVECLSGKMMSLGNRCSGAHHWSQTVGLC